MISTNQRNENVKKILYKLTGISLVDNKDIMISNRLQKLRRNLNYHGDIDDLLASIESDQELITQFINTFTTNKTNFFREEFHFNDLLARVLPEFASYNAPRVNIFCCASSTGEEPYSIAMTIKEAEVKYTNKIKASIIASDIDTNVLKKASEGIYGFSKSGKEFPDWINPGKYFKKRVKNSEYHEEILIKAKDELKELITFQELNLTDERYPFEDDYFDVVFCRNVLIYFNENDQNKILVKLFKKLKMGGTLYIGHSESPRILTKHVERIGQNIFLKIKEYI